MTRTERILTDCTTLALQLSYLEQVHGVRVNNPMFACPLHGANSHMFLYSVTDDGRIFYQCYLDGDEMDVIDLIARLERCNREHALDLLQTHCVKLAIQNLIQEVEVHAHSEHVPEV